MSKEHKKYLMSLKLNKLLVSITQISIFILFIIIWQFLASKNYINSFITSSPSKILSTISKLYIENNLFIHIWITIKETLISFIVTTLLSIIVSIILYESNFLSKVIDPYLTILNSLPKVSLGPIIIIWIGANQKGIITMAILISVIVSIQSIYNGFINTDKLKIKLLETFNATKKDILFNVVIPSNKSTIISTLKINISMCLIGQVV